MKGYVLFSCLLCITGVVPQFFGSQTFSLTKDQRSPTNCLQYFTTPTGTISSFNYGVHTAGPRQISNLDYLACVSTQTTFCSITYTSPGAYLVTGESATPGADYETDAACLTDYIEFRAGSQYIDLTGMGAMVTRFCGSLFPLAGVTSTNDVTATFFDLRIVTNSVEKTTDADLLNVGFSFNYASSVTGSIDAVRTTGGVLNVPFGYFLSESPATDTQLIIRQSSVFFCQVKITIFILNLAGPDENGNCIEESLTFSGQLPNRFTICGLNIAQHVYFRFTEGRDIIVDIQVTNPEAVWVMQIEQILCFNTAELAPPGCLQYYKRPVGIVSSFGFAGDQENNTNTTQISNLNYNICFDDSPQYCRMSLLTTIFDGLTSTELRSLLGLPQIAALPPLLEDGIPSPLEIMQHFLNISIPFGYSITEIDNMNDANYLGNLRFDENCTTDYLEINNAIFADYRVNIDFNIVPPPPSVDVSLTRDHIPFTRMCGYLQDESNDNALGETLRITKTQKPFVIKVVTDGSELPNDTANKGFRFRYYLLRC